MENILLTVAGLLVCVLVLVIIQRKELDRALKNVDGLAWSLDGYNTQEARFQAWEEKKRLYEESGTL